MVRARWMPARPTTTSTWRRAPRLAPAAAASRSMRRSEVRARPKLRRRSLQIGAGSDPGVHGLRHLFRKHRGDHVVVLQSADAEGETLERRMSDEAFEALRREILATPKP